MAVKKADYVHLIEFVQPSLDQNNTLLNSQFSQMQSTISGAEARVFYEELCSTSSDLSCPIKKKYDFIHVAKGVKTVKSEMAFNSYSEESVDGTLIAEGRQIQPNSNININLNRDLVTKGSGMMGKNCLKTELLHKTASKSSSERDYLTSSSECEKHAKTNERLMNRRQAELLKCAQNGDTSRLKLLIQMGVDVNFCDMFGWTAAMCAAFEGHLNVLEHLCDAGADFNFCNAHCQSALSLAQEKHHDNIVHFLQTIHKPRTTVTDIKTPTEIQSFICEICKREFTDMDQRTHATSTVHLFNSGYKPKDGGFFISPSNKGYHLLLKGGWDGNRGLGPHGQGHRFPLKTLLKRDRKGLGNICKEKEKVTHFQPHDTSSVSKMQKMSSVSQRKANVKTLSRQAHKAKERRDRLWEIQMRQLLS